MAKAKTPTSWRNRIIGHGEEAPDQLLANPRNWRIHPKHQQAALGGVLDQVGWVQQILVNQRTGHVVDGHLRVSLAISRNEPSVPVTYLDLTEQEEALILATFDPIAALAGTDQSMLDDLLRDAVTDDTGVAALLANLAHAGLSDPRDEWQGMPEFQQEDQSAAFKVIVNFDSEEDMLDFERVVGQKIPRNTRSMWHPHREWAEARKQAYVEHAS